MKTNYAAHDARYRRQRAEGAPGWDSEESYRETAAELDWLAAARAALPGPHGRRVLEIGCGAGNLAPRLVERGFEVTGVDISEAAVAWANDRGVPGARFFVGDIVAGIPGEFDLVIDGHCLHCIIGADRARVLGHVRGALAPGGLFFVATMCGPITSPELAACFDPGSRCQVVDGVAYRTIGEADDILEELRRAGFTIVASTIQPRKHALDQDHLWALVRSAV